MPKRDYVRRIDSGQQSGGVPGTTYVVAGTGDANTVDGFHASSSPMANGLIALDASGKLPVSVIPDGLVSAGVDVGGMRYIGPTCYLTRKFLQGDQHIYVDNLLFSGGDEYVMLSRWNLPFETVQLIGLGEVDPDGNAGYRYGVVRNFRTADKESKRVDYPVGTQVIGLGRPGVSGFLTINAGGSNSVNAPNISAWTNSGSQAAIPTWELTMGRLSGMTDPNDPARVAFVAKFPNFNWESFGLASRNIALDGEFAVSGGSIYGDLDVTGTIRVQDPDSSSSLELGHTMAGYGWVLRGSSGPAVMALAPYADDSGVISPVAFVINNRGKRGLFFYEDPATQEGRLEIGADTLVGGTFRIGETFLVGEGEWGNGFKGIAIDSRWGLVGMAPDDTFTDYPTKNNYQVWWDITSGKLRTGGGAIGFGNEGMSLQAAWPGDLSAQSIDDPDVVWPATIKWFESGKKSAEIGSWGQGWLRLSMWDDVSGTTDIRQSITMSTNDGLRILNETTGSKNEYIAPGGGHHFYVAGEEVFSVGGSSGFQIGLPATLVGNEVTTYWNEAGRFGMNTSSPQAYMHINGGSTVPQLRLSSSDLYTDWRVSSSGTTWTTTGDVMLGPSTGAIKPTAPIGASLGTPYNRFQDIYAASLHVEQLVAQYKIATIGGRVIVAPTTQLTAPLEASTGAGTIYVKHNSIVSGDILVMEAVGKLEALLVTSAASAAGDGYRYSVTRGYDTTTAAAWDAGAAVLNTGHVGSGFIDLYSQLGIGDSTRYGPTITGNVRFSTAWNGWAPRWTIGNLRGVYGYSGSDYWGVAFGNPSATHITIDDSNGYRLRNNATTIAQWNAAGDLSLGATGAVSITAAGDATFTGTVTATSGTFTGTVYATDGAFNGAVTATSGSFTGTVTADLGSIGGWTIGSSALTSNSGSTGLRHGGVVAGVADVAIHVGGTTENAPFRVWHDGSFWAKSGTIGGTTGFTIATGNLQSGDGTFVLDAANKKIKFGVAEMYYSSTYGSLYILGGIRTTAGISTTNGSFTSSVTSASTITANKFNCQGSDGVSGTFTNPTSITVKGGLITAIS